MTDKQLIELHKIIDCSQEKQLKILKIRNDKDISSSMYSEHEISVEEHLKWIDGLRSDEKQLVFIVMKDNEPVGVVSVNDIDVTHKKADWAFYLHAKERGGLGAALEWFILEFVFNCLRLEKLNCEVIETNKTVVKMHNKFSFVEEGFRRSNVEKDGLRIGVYFLGLTKEDWLNNKEAVFNKYSKILSKFDVKFC